MEDLSTMLVVPGGTALVSEPQVSGPALSDPRGGFASSGTNGPSASRDLNATSRSDRKAPAGAGLAPGKSPKDGLRVTDRVGAVAIPARRGPALSVPGAGPAGI